MRIFLTTILLLISTNISNSVVAQTIDCSQQKSYVDSLTQKIANENSDLQTAQTNLSTCQSAQQQQASVQTVMATPAYQTAIAQPVQVTPQPVQANPGTSLSTQGTVNIQ